MGDRLATTDMGRKVEGAVPLMGEAGSPCNTMWPAGPRPTFVPSGIHLDSSSRLATTGNAENWDSTTWR